MTTALRRGKKLVSFRVETSVILGVILVLLILPGVAVASMTNIEDMLKNGISAGDAGNGVFYMEAGNPIPNTWGNAADWAWHARLEGYKVDQAPAVGAIMQTANSAGGLGHVAYVTEVNSVTGTWKISEMNSKGLNIVSDRTRTMAQALDYNFIHDKEQ